MADVDFEQAVAVREYSQKIIDLHHPHLQDAKDLIGYYFRYGNSDWAGKAKKCTAFERHVTGFMLFVFINHDAWEALKDEQRFALVDHELCHFSRSSRREYDAELQKFVDTLEPAESPESWTMRDHDVEEFSEVIRRHGLWEKGIESFAVEVRRATNQTSFEHMLDDEDERIIPFRGGAMA